MGDKKIYIVAKAFNKHGSYAYLCKSKDELECVPETLQLMSRRGIQIVLVNNPDIYSEYAPHNVYNVKNRLLLIKRKEFIN